MNLTELIEEFKEASGRLDLSDGDITKYLNRGSKLLDRRRKGKRSESRAFASVQPGSFVVTVDPSLRSIDSVWAMTSSRRWELLPADIAELRNLYNAQPTTVAQADPTVYALTPVTLGPGGASDGQTIQDDFFPQWSSDVQFMNHQGYRGMILHPIPQELTVIEVVGLYYTPELSTEVGQMQNWWSMNHAHLLIQAALLSLDINYRNTAGAKELYTSIDADLEQIYFDEIEEEANQPSRMEG